MRKQEPFPKDAPNIKDAKPRKKTNVKHYSGLGIAPTIEERFDDLFSDPLEDLYLLWEQEMNVVPKPDLGMEEPAGVAGPNEGNFEHPVTQQRNQVDDARKQGMDAVEAHQSVHGEVETGSAASKSKLAATLGRVQDDGNRRAVVVEPEKGSILAKDVEVEAEMDQVTHDDLRTPMNKQVPDRQQQPQDQVGGQVEMPEEMDYNDDVAYLQKFGRA